jgi:hypothetical protein
MVAHIRLFSRADNTMRPEAAQMPRAPDSFCKPGLFWHIRAVFIGETNGKTNDDGEGYGHYGARH